MDRRTLIASLAAAVPLAAAGRALAADDPATGVFTTLFSDPSKAMFDPVMFTKSPFTYDQLTQFLKNITASLGAFKSAAKDDNGYALTFAAGTARSTLTLGSDGKITGLFFAAFMADKLLAVLNGILHADHLDPAAFNQAFLAQVPAAQIDAMMAQVRTQAGALQGVSSSPRGYAVKFANATLIAEILVDGDGKVAFYQLHP